jgi:anti-sigma B factor antagonist
MQLGLEVDERDGATVVTVRGEVDLGSGHHLRDIVLEQLLAGRLRVVVDLREVEFLDSVGLGMLVAARKRARSLGGDLLVVATTDRVRRPFEVTGIAGAFGLHATVADAAGALGAGEGAGR